MNDFFSKLKDYGVLVWFALSAIVVIAALCIHGYDKKRGDHLVQEPRGESKGRLQFTRSA